MSARIFTVRMRELGIFGKLHEARVRADDEREAEVRAIQNRYGRGARLAFMRGSAVGVVERPMRQHHGYGWAIEPCTGPMVVSVAEEGADRE